MFLCVAHQEWELYFIDVVSPVGSAVCVKIFPYWRRPAGERGFTDRQDTMATSKKSGTADIPFVVVVVEM